MVQIDWSRVWYGENWYGQGKLCGGSYIYKGRLNSLEGCGLECKKISWMFIYGTNDFGGNACTNTECECYCSTTATLQESCPTTSNNYYRLYRYLNSELGDYVRLYFLFNSSEIIIL